MLTHNGIVDLTDHLSLTSNDPLRVLVRQDVDVDPASLPEPEYDRADVRLESPVQRPGKIIAAPLNYEDHVTEIEGFDMDIKEAGHFLKVSSSVIRPEDTIVLPFVDRRCDYDLDPTALWFNKDVLEKVRYMDFEEAVDYEVAKLEQMNYLQGSGWVDSALSSSEDREFCPSLKSYSRDG